VKLGGERFGRDAVGHLVLGLAALGAALGAGGPVAGALLAEAGRRLGFAEAALGVSALYGNGTHAASRSSASRVRSVRVPSGR